MASLYAQYILERTNDRILETPSGYATYRYLPDGQSVYIVDIFTLPEDRKRGDAAALADSIACEAKARGCTEMIGTVVPSTKGSTTSLKVLLGYGFTLHSASNDVIVFKKEI